MKILLLISIIGILLIGVITAGIGLTSRELILDKEKVDALEEIGLTDYKATDFQKGSDYQRCLKKEICETKTIIKEDYDEEMNYYNYSYSYQDCRNIIDKCSPLLNDTKKVDEWERTLLEKTLPDAIEKREEARSVEINIEKVNIITSK